MSAKKGSLMSTGAHSGEQSGARGAASQLAKLALDAADEKKPCAIASKVVNIDCIAEAVTGGAVNIGNETTELTAAGNYRLKEVMLHPLTIKGDGIFLSFNGQGFDLGGNFESALIIEDSNVVAVTGLGFIKNGKAPEQPLNALNGDVIPGAITIKNSSDLFLSNITINNFFAGLVAYGASLLDVEALNISDISKDYNGEVLGGFILVDNTALVAAANALTILNNKLVSTKVQFGIALVGVAQASVSNNVLQVSESQALVLKQVKKASEVVPLAKKAKMMLDDYPEFALGHYAGLYARDSSNLGFNFNNVSGNVFGLVLDGVNRAFFGQNTFYNHALAHVRVMRSQNVDIERSSLYQLTAHAIPQDILEEFQPTAFKLEASSKVTFQFNDVSDATLEFPQDKFYGLGVHVDAASSSNILSDNKLIRCYNGFLIQGVFNITKSNIANDGGVYGFYNNTNELDRFKNGFSNNIVLRYQRPYIHILDVACSCDKAGYFANIYYSPEGKTCSSDIKVKAVEEQASQKSAQSRSIKK